MPLPTSCKDFTNLCCPICLQLALGRPVDPHSYAAVRPGADDVLRTLAAMPSLVEVVVLAGYVGASNTQSLEVLLGLAGCRRGGLPVRALRRSEFFVADPTGAH